MNSEAVSDSVKTNSRFKIVQDSPTYNIFWLFLIMDSWTLYFPDHWTQFTISEMRTARNIFIATLAVADTSLCLFAMPMTLMGILKKYWPFGTDTWILCKISRTSPAVTVFFSSYTLAVIALDRHRFIVHSAKRQVSRINKFLN